MTRPLFHSAKRLSAIYLGAVALLGACAHTEDRAQETQQLSPSGALVELFVSTWRRQAGDAKGNECTGKWSQAVTNDYKYMVPWFPETKAAYWAFGYDRAELPEDISLKFEGEFPYARYMSIHLYDGLTGKKVSGKNGLKDIEITPLAGNSNPFRPGTARDVEERSYQLTIKPRPASMAAGDTLPANELHIPDETRYPLIILRIYRPDEGQNVQGGVELPKVHAFNASTDEPASGCPQPVMPVTEGLDPSKRPDTRRFYNESISFFAKHPDLSGLFGNQHNYYGFAGITPELGDVALFKFKAPSTPDTASGAGNFSPDIELRYWSICISGDVFTNTSSCVWDDVAVVDERGIAKFAIGPDTEEFRARAIELGYNPMAWGYHLRHFVYHRNMLGEGDFQSTYKSVPHVDQNEPLAPQRAENYMGEYAPTGFYCELSEFYEKECGL